MVFSPHLSEVKHDLELELQILSRFHALGCFNSQKISGFSELTLNINGIRWIWMSDAFHIHGRILLSCGRTFHIHGKALKKSCRRMRFFVFLGQFRL